MQESDSIGRPHRTAKLFAQVVQIGLHEAMSSSDDDSGMWESFHEVRRLPKKSVRTSGCALQILATAGRAAKRMSRSCASMLERLR